MNPLTISPEHDAATPTVTHFHDSAVWTGARASEFSRWMEHRRHLITASRMSAILGVDPWRDPLDVYVDMTRLPENDTATEARDDTELDDPRMWGRELEQTIARIVARKHDWELFEGGALLVSRSRPFIGATLDDEIFSRTREQWLVYEGKTVSQFKTKDWDEQNQALPDHVMVQAQTQLLVTGAPAAVVFALVGGNSPRQIQVLPDPELHAVMVEAVDEFIERCRQLDPPPPTARSKKALQQLYPEENGEVITLDQEVLEWTQEWMALGEQRRGIERREEEIRNRIRMAMGEASHALLPGPLDDGKSKQWKLTTQTMPERMMAGWSTRVLKLVNAPKAEKSRASNCSATTKRRRRGRA